jgi:hypothetical protein
MTRPQSPLQDGSGTVEPGFADLPVFLAAPRAHDSIESDPQARLEASPAEPGMYDGERLPPGRQSRPGEH